MNGIKRSASPYKASLTRRQYLFHEMRTTARLVAAGLSDEKIVQTILAENLFQYPTEKSVRDLARICIQRLRGLDDSALVQSIADAPSDVAKQICLYAMMKQSRLVRDFMVDVIGTKYRQQDLSFGKIDLNAFFFRLQEQDTTVATWSGSTVSKLKQVLTNVLIENGYLDSPKSTTLNPVLIDSSLLNSIEIHNDSAVLPAFNNFSGE